MMERKKILAANWKMNLDFNSAIKLTEGISTGIQNKNIITVIFPPSLYLSEVNKITLTNNIYSGAQNCSSFSSGAYTGELSASMIKSCGADYCLVGHSERRNLFGDSDEIINKKINECIVSGLNPILCVGEILENRNQGIHFEVVEQQIKIALTGFHSTKIENLILAYEPVWAIGTGLTATPDQAQEMHAFIRGKLIELFGETFGMKISILYGGSCNAKNATELFCCPDVDGGLIGSASLKSDEFIKISECFPVK